MLVLLQREEDDWRSVDISQKGFIGIARQYEIRDHHNKPSEGVAIHDLRTERGRNTGLVKKYPQAAADGRAV